MKVLGISSFYHDSAAALVVDGEIIAAAQEERFTRKKHDANFPSRAIGYVLREGKLQSLAEVDAVVFYEKPFLKFERLFETYTYFAPKGFLQFYYAMKSLLFDKKLFIRDVLVDHLHSLYGDPKDEIKKKLFFNEHHFSHAASAFYPSPFEEAAILTIDGVGEWTTASIGYGQGKEITILKEMHYPHSLGLLYSAFTYYCGFKVNSGEYKLMGLAPYGNPDSRRYRDFYKIIRDHIVEIYDDGSIYLNQEYFSYNTGLKMVSEEKWKKLFGIPPRKPEDNLSQEYADLALAIQTITEEVMFKMAEEARRLTGSKNLTMAGGVALNCVGNGKILMRRIFENIWIQPAAGDAGGALGAALSYSYANGDERVVLPSDSMKGSYLGPSYGDKEILEVIRKYDAVYNYYEEEELVRKVAEYLAGGAIVGWFQGRMEWGPRALGNRSILADARNPEMQKILNLKTKFREGFRPFAPSVLYEDVHEYFEYGFESPYMLLIDYVKPERRRPLPENYHNLPWQEKLYYLRSDVPAITHLDFSARVQTVRKETNPRFHKLLQKFKEITGYGILINTSFNVRGEPIVNTPDDAYRCFMGTAIDYLVIENYVFEKAKQPRVDNEWKQNFELD